MKRKITIIGVLGLILLLYLSSFPILAKDITQNIKVDNNEKLVQKQNEIIDVYVKSKKTGQPLKNAAISFSQGLKFEYKSTDRKGYCRFEGDYNGIANINIVVSKIPFYKAETINFNSPRSGEHLELTFYLDTVFSSKIKTIDFNSKICRYPFIEKIIQRLNL